MSFHRMFAKIKEIAEFRLFLHVTIFEFRKQLVQGNGIYRFKDTHMSEV